MRTKDTQVRNIKSFRKTLIGNPKCRLNHRYGEYIDSEYNKYQDTTIKKKKLFKIKYKVSYLIWTLNLSLTH